MLNFGYYNNMKINHFGGASKKNNVLLCNNQFFLYHNLNKWPTCVSITEHVRQLSSDSDFKRNPVRGKCF